MTTDSQVIAPADAEERRRKPPVVVYPNGSLPGADMAMLARARRTLTKRDEIIGQLQDIVAEDVTAIGFTLVFRTWGDTRVARVRADWLAIGPADHVDDFAVD